MTGNTVQVCDVSLQDEIQVLVALSQSKINVPNDTDTTGNAANLPNSCLSLDTVIQGAVNIILELSDDLVGKVGRHQKTHYKKH